MKQFLFQVLFIAICAILTEARVQRAAHPATTPTRIWSQPFIRPQLFNVRQVLERTNGELYHSEEGNVAKEEGSNKMHKVAAKPIP